MLGVFVAVSAWPFFLFHFFTNIFSYGSFSVYFLIRAHMTRRPDDQKIRPRHKGHYPPTHNYLQENYLKICKFSLRLSPEKVSR
jgi:hypothetical protein